jgi:hypothetical protein
MRHRTRGAPGFHSEAIMLGVTPVQALQPIHDATVQATKQAPVINQRPGHPWTPHITACYSTRNQPAQHHRHHQGAGRCHVVGSRGEGMPSSWITGGTPQHSIAQRGT